MFFDEFADHRTRLSQLNCYPKFYKTMNSNEEFMSNLTEQLFGKTVVCISNHKTYIMDTLFLRTAQRTLNSIFVCCSYGCFADANVLVRKYRDDLFQYLFIVDVLGNRKGLTNDEIDELIPGKLDAEKFCSVVDSIMKVSVDGSRKDKNDKAVDAWFDDRVSNGSFHKELSIENYMRYLKRNQEIHKCISEHGLHDVWENIRRRLNDYTHVNGKRFLEHNLVECLSVQEIESCISEISDGVSFITSVFLVFLILIKPESIMSSDYIDSVEMGFEPPEGSLYWVAPFVKKYIDRRIVKLHPELKSFLHNNNKYGMVIK